MTDAFGAFACGDHPLAPLTPAQLPRALALSTLVGWNQTAADWRVFLDRGQVMGLDDGEPELAASVATLHYGAVAWISMVLVRPDQRRRGLARAAMQWAIASLRQAGAGCIALDATPDGRQVYRQLGFSDAWGFSRWSVPPLPPLPGTRRMMAADWPAVLALDAAAFGADRAWLLGALPAGFVVEEGGRVVAAALRREGTRWPQAGPIFAREARHGQALLAAVLPGGGIADLRDDVPFLPWLEEELGARLRRFTRMVLDGALPGDVGGCMAVLGPEFG